MLTEEQLNFSRELDKFIIEFNNQYIDLCVGGIKQKF